LKLHRVNSHVPGGENRILDKVSNRFEKSKTAFQGSKATARNATREIVTALREIAEGKVRRQNSDEE